jgi:hypothetical protein
MIEAILYIEKRSNPGKFDAGMEMTAEQYVIALKNGAMLFDPEDKLDDILNGRNRTISREHVVSRKEKPSEEISCRALIDEVMGTATLFKGDRNYVVIRFDRSAAAAMNGTGWQLEFDSPYKNECTDKCDFMWRLEGDIVTISYRKSGWKSVTFNIREMTLNSSKFSGYLYVVDDHRYTINYDKSTFSDWSKYTNN